MSRKLLYLNGLAILAVVIGHAAQRGQMAMVWWVDRYRTVSVPNYDAVGSPAYYGLFLQQVLVFFSVPAFLFVSGFFMAYSAQTLRSAPPWGVIGMRISRLLVPYTIWSLVAFGIQGLEGDWHTPIEYFGRLIYGAAVGAYWYIPMLVQLMAIAPFITRIARNRWRLLLGVSALVQIAMAGLQYITVFGNASGWAHKILILRTGLPPLFIQLGFYFVLGIVYGINQREFNSWLVQRRRVLLFAAGVLGLLSVLEIEIMTRMTGVDCRDVSTLTLHMYAVTLILGLMGLDRTDLRCSKYLYQFGRRSFGVYLLHPWALEFVSRAVQRLCPLVLKYHGIFQCVLIISAIAAPLIMMTLVSRSPAREYYRLLFGS